MFNNIKHNLLRGKINTGKCYAANLVIFSVMAVSAATSRAVHAQTIGFVGADLTTHASWRTSSVTKTLDGDGDNIYGTDGYYIQTGGTISSAPAYATVARLTTSTFPGNGGYSSIDNPTGSGSVRTGVWYSSTGNGSEDNFASIVMSQAKSFRIGILVDNTDFPDISPDNLRVKQTVGGSANTGLINSYLQPSSPSNSDWYFFDILNAKVGDTFVISGTNKYGGSGPQASNGIGGITFDSTSSSVPEPGAIALGVGAFSLGGLALVRRRRRLRK